MTAQQIIEARQLLGLSPKEFANEVGVSYRAVVKWERGERKANGAAVKSIKRLVEEVENGKAS
jgi:DNA-binding transcriptional regulator YiaG